MRKLWVLGNGQLGAMLKHAAESLNIDLLTVDIGSDQLLPLSDDDVITAEREHWPKNRLTEQLTAHPNFKNPRAFIDFSDRLLEKQLFDRLDLATAQWRPVVKDTQENDLYQSLGESIVLKRRQGGYDGKGQQWLTQKYDNSIPQDWHEQAIAEQAIAFDEEVSLLGARSEAGQIVFYPLTLNLHQGGILLASIAPLKRLRDYQAEAELMLSRLMNALDYVGVMAMECFRVGDHLMVNEVAPRVHNSGHWTMTGASLSQFDLHVRALMVLPIEQPEIKNTNVMINLIGLEWDERWLSVPHATVYWYDKQVLPGRKLGHINLDIADKLELEASLQALEGLLDERYNAMFGWIKKEFA